MKLRLSTMCVLVVAAGCGFSLFQTSQNVQQAEHELRNVQASLDKERDVIRVLETEWDYLNRPTRLEDLVKQHLDMQSTAPKALVRDSGDVPQHTLPVPVHKPAAGVQPALMKPAAPATAAPAPATDKSPRKFNDLIDTLTQPEGGQP